MSLSGPYWPSLAPARAASTPGSAGADAVRPAVLHALTHALGLVDGPVELSVDHQGAQLGLPVHFTAGHPTVRLPRLDPAERRLLAAADHKIHLAYKTISHHLEGAR